MYDYTFNKQVQISRSDIRPHIKWAVSLVILHMITSIFLRALCGYIWVNILTLSPRGASKITNGHIRQRVKVKMRSQNGDPFSLKKYVWMSMAYLESSNNYNYLICPSIFPNNDLHLKVTTTIIILSKTILHATDSRCVNSQTQRFLNHKTTSSGLYCL